MLADAGAGAAYACPGMWSVLRAQTSSAKRRPPPTTTPPPCYRLYRALTRVFCFILHFTVLPRARATFAFLPFCRAPVYGELPKLKADPQPAQPSLASISS